MLQVQPVEALAFVVMEVHNSTRLAVVHYQEIGLHEQQGFSLSSRGKTVTAARTATFHCRQAAVQAYIVGPCLCSIAGSDAEQEKVPIKELDLQGAQYGYFR